jgi:hypothetical protein
VIRPFSARIWLPFAAAAALSACGHDSTSPSAGPPARLDALSEQTRSAQVGMTVPGGIVVKVSDASGRPVAGASVALAVTLGNGVTMPRVAVTDAKGQATATWTLGTIIGQNEVTANVDGVVTSIRFSAMGVAGPITTITITPQNPRLLPNVDSVRVSAKSLDSFGNTASPSPTLVSRDPSLVSVDATGLVRVIRRGSGTYVVASAGGKSDSVLVTVLAAGQSICTAAATPVEMSVGQVVTDVSGQGFCVHAATANAEYALIPFYDSGVASATTTVEVRGLGLASLPLPSPNLIPRANALLSAPTVVPNDAFENALRVRERTEAARRFGNSGAARSALRDLVAKAATVAVPAVGDLMKINANANDFCDNPDLRTGRVMAVTDKAIVVADTTNPAGGFTAEEYRSIGVTFDTLVDPVDRSAFGAPSDIDNNGHVIMFFTQAVNELTPAQSSTVTLGFFYARDLYPKTAPPGPCVGSNVGEVFYLLVADTAGTVNGNKRSKSLVTTLTNGTVAHEYQHLINASRRMYVNSVGTVFEERWLDEGLSHVAEELNFFQAAGRSPRNNLDATLFADPALSAAYSTFSINNIRRYAQYLPRTETQGPVGFDAFDDDLPTRGAIWSFLRYAADHVAASNENSLWFKLVNSKASGMTNLANALGVPPNTLLRDWATSVFVDDNATSVDPRFQQLSWNTRSILTGNGTSTPFPLVTRLLNVDGSLLSTSLVGNGVTFLRFSVPSGQDALLTTTSGGQPLPSSVRLSVVRVR